MGMQKNLTALKKNSATHGIKFSNHIIKLGFEPNSYPPGYQVRLCTNRISTGAIEIIQVYSNKQYLL